MYLMKLGEELEMKSVLAISMTSAIKALQDGFGIAWATCEKLVEAKSFTFFTTHYDELHHLSLLYPGGPLEFQAVSLFRLASVREGTRLRHRYKLQTEEESDNTAEEYV